MTDDNFDDDSIGDSADDEFTDGNQGDDVDGQVEDADSRVEDADTTPGPAAWTRPDATGVPSVDAAIDDLTRLDQLPTGEHVAVYDALHRQLQDALADLDGA